MTQTAADAELLAVARVQRIALHAASLTSATGIALALFAQGCSCGPSTASLDGGSFDAGPLFGGIDAPGYEPTDSGPRPPEPCAVPVRRVRFSVGDGSLGHTNRLWASGSHAWVYLGGFPGAVPVSPPPSLHFFDLVDERELEVDFVPGEEDRDDILGVFEAPAGYEIVARNRLATRVVHVGHDGRLTGAPEARLELASSPLVRLDDGRYVGMALDEGVTSPVPAALEIAAPSGTVRRIELGFRTMSGHLSALRWTGETLVGVGYEDEATRMRRFEVDLEMGVVRLATLVEGVRLFGVVGARIALWSSTTTATVALTYEPADDVHPAQQIAELFWWPIGGDPVTRHVVRPPSDLSVGILALGGDMPTQTVVLAQTSTLRTWVTAARIRAPGDVVGGIEPIGVFTSITDAAAWESSEGTAALALLSQHELEALYVCEGAP